MARLCKEALLRAIIIAAALLGLTSASAAGHPQTAAEVWAYLAAPSGGSDRWAVIGSKKNKGYFQCEAEEDVVLCPFPVWLRLKPGTSGDYKPEGSRGMPYEDLPGSQTTQFITAEQVGILKQRLQRHGADPVDVYFKAVDRAGRQIGTSYEIRIVLERDFKNFAPLVDDVMSGLWNTGPDDYSISGDW